VVNDSKTLKKDVTTITGASTKENPVDEKAKETKMLPSSTKPKLAPNVAARFAFDPKGPLEKFLENTTLIIKNPLKKSSPFKFNLKKDVWPDLVKELKSHKEKVLKDAAKTEVK
jgi:hypothetical protein